MALLPFPSRPLALLKVSEFRVTDRVPTIDLILQGFGLWVPTVGILAQSFAADLFFKCHSLGFRVVACFQNFSEQGQG